MTDFDLQFDVFPPAIIVEVFRCGSLRKAAQKFKVDQATIARRIDGFEKAVGHPIISRNSRGVTLTPAGMRLLNPSIDIVNHFNVFREQVYNVTEQRMSQVSLSAPRPLITHLYVPAFNVKKTGHPRLSFKKNVAWEKMPTITFHRGLDEDSEPDIFLMFSPDGEIPSNLGNDVVVKKIGETRFTIWASQDYIDMHGVPKTFGDLKDHIIINNALQKKVRMLEPWNTVIQNARINGELENSNDVVPLIEAGTGIGLLTSAAGFYSDKIICIEPHDMPHMSCPLYIALKRENRSIPSVELVYDTLINITSDSPWFDEDHEFYASAAGLNSKPLYQRINNAA